MIGTTGGGGKRGFLRGGFALLGFGPAFTTHVGGLNGTLGGGADTGINPFDWDVSTAAKPHIPNDPNAKIGAISASQASFGGKTLQCKALSFFKVSAITII